MTTFFACWIAAASAAVPVAEVDAVRAALSVDDLAASRTAATTLANDPAADATLVTPARALAAATDLAAARVAFADLSKAAILGLDPKDKVHVYHCPMAPGYGYWFQQKAGLVNPFFGQAMASCGEGVPLKAAQAAAGAK